MARRSARKTKRSTAATPAAVAEGGPPEPVCRDDGTFYLLGSDGLPFEGTCDLSAKGEPISGIPDPWLIDWNIPDHPYTLRVYRPPFFATATEDAQEVQHTYDPKKRSWTRRAKKAGSTSGLATAPRFPFLRTCLRRTVWFLRWLLGDFEKLHLFGQWVPAQPILIGKSGEYHINDDIFKPITLFENGDVFIDQKRYSQNHRIRVETGIAGQGLLFLRKRGRFQFLYIFSKYNPVDDDQNTLPNVLFYSRRTWWSCKRIRQGSIYDRTPRLAQAIARLFTILGVLWILLFFFLAHRLSVQ